LPLQGAGNGSEVARLFNIKNGLLWKRKTQNRLEKQEENQRLTLPSIGIPST
jgi:hypothetical protein